MTKLSNDDWQSPSDPDSRIAKMKDGTTHLAYKAEHAVDLDTEVILAAEVYFGDQADSATIEDTLSLASGQVIEVKRDAIYVGKLRMRDTEKIADRIEALLSALSSRRPFEPDLAEWIADVPDWLAEKLADKQLIAPRVRTAIESTLLGGFIDAYLASRTDIKPRTRINLLQVRRNLVSHFGESKPLAEVSPADADEWRRWLLGRQKPLGENTVRRHCGRAKQLFRAALRKRLIAENPFADMRDCLVKANKSREFFLSRADAAKIVAACPDNEWRLIFTLARFGGLRTPSETLGLRWNDVDWARERLLIRSPKTEHHEGKESRWIPLFPELRKHLDAAWDMVGNKTEFVINRYRDSNANLRTHLLRIVNKAGLKPWPKLFQNLRSSRETELAESFPIHVVTAWLGNSQLIATKHYLQVTDAHFDEATRFPTHALTEIEENAENRVIRPARENEKTSEKPRFVQSGVPPQGLEP